MSKTLLQRLLALPVLVWAANLAGFAYAWLARRAFIANSPFVAERDETPFLLAYQRYFGQLLHLQFGALPRAGDRVGPAVFSALGYSLLLLLIAFAAATGLGLALGLRAAHSQPPRLARWLLPLVTLGQAIPSFYLGILGIALALALNVGLPTQGAGSPAHVLLPALALMLRPGAQIAQISAHLLIDELGQPYVTTARALGNSLDRARRHHALPNIGAPVVAAIANAARGLVGELIIVEWLFNWPGLGRLLAQTLIQPASTARAEGVDLFLHPELLALSMAVLAVLFLGIDLLARGLTQRFDPRLRGGPSHDAALANTPVSA